MDGQLGKNYYWSTDLGGGAGGAPKTADPETRPTAPIDMANAPLSCDGAVDRVDLELRCRLRFVCPVLPAAVLLPLAVLFVLLPLPL